MLDAAENGTAFLASLGGEMVNIPHLWDTHKNLRKVDSGCPHQVWDRAVA